MRHMPDAEEVREMIRRAVAHGIADALRTLAASSTPNPATMVTAADLEHVADIVEGKIAPVKP